MPRRIVVLGAGATGWLAANVLHRAMNAGRPNSVEVTVVDSGDDGTSGMGEAMLPFARPIFRALGFDERELVCTADGSFRHGTRFDGWLDAPRGDVLHSHYQLFDVYQGCRAIDTGRLWLADRSLSPHAHYAYAVGIQASLCDRMLGPRLACSRPYEAPVEYGYQLGTGGLTRFLREQALRRGVHHVGEAAVAAERDADGDVVALRTRSARHVPGDFFVDCSGSRRMLVAGALAQPFLAWRDALPCDRAIAVEVSVPPSEAIAPFVLATARPSGWTCEVSLARSRSCTYFYSGAFVSDEQAEREVRTFFGAGVSGAGQSVRRTVRTSGRLRCLWVRNCVAIGDAGGSVEPLECSGLDLAAAGLRTLARLKVHDLDDPAHAGRYNETMGALYDEALDIAGLHYSLSRRNDTAFWRACRHELGIPPRVRLAASLGAARGGERDDKAVLFGCEPYRHLLAGMGRLDAPIPMPENGVDAAVARSLFRSIEKRRAQALAGAHDHAMYVRELRIVRKSAGPPRSVSCPQAL